MDSGSRVALSASSTLRGGFIFIVVVVALWAADPATAQVVIRECVELSPADTTVDYHPGPAGPRSQLASYEFPPRRLLELNFEPGTILDTGADVGLFYDDEVYPDGPTLNGEITIEGLRADSSAFSETIPLADHVSYDVTGSMTLCNGTEQIPFDLYRAIEDIPIELGEVLGNITVTTSFADPDAGPTQISQSGIYEFDSSPPGPDDYPYCTGGDKVITAADLALSFDPAPQFYVRTLPGFVQAADTGYVRLTTEGPLPGGGDVAVNIHTNRPNVATLVYEQYDAVAAEWTLVAEGASLNAVPYYTLDPSVPAFGPQGRVLLLAAEQVGTSVERVQVSAENSNDPSLWGQEQVPVVGPPTLELVCDAGPCDALDAGDRAQITQVRYLSNEEQGVFTPPATSDVYLQLDEAGQAAGEFVLVPADPDGQEQRFATQVVLPYAEILDGRLYYEVTDPTAASADRAVIWVLGVIGVGSQPFPACNDYIKPYDPDFATRCGEGAVDLLNGITLSFDEDPASYLPVEEDVVEVTATINPPPPPGSTVTFELTQDHEFEFAQGGAGPYEVEVTGNTAQIQLRSTTYWGVATVQATYTPADGEPQQVQQQIPVDTDEDTIADVWELDSENGGTLALGDTDLDGDWDEETSLENENDGDGFSKMNEYKGVIVDGVHRRMQASRKEVFVNIVNAQEGNFAVQGLEQLDLEVIVFQQRPLDFLGSYPRLGIIIEDKTIRGAFDDGVIYQDGRETGHTATLGQTIGTKDGTAFCDVYVETIQHLYTDPAQVTNLSDANYTSESDTVTFVTGVPVPVGTTDFPGIARYEAVFDGSDLNGDGDSDDLINPFDLFAEAKRPLSSANNDAIDGVSRTLTFLQALQRTTRHEAAHGVGVAANCGKRNCHPETGSSVMRQGIGPAAIDNFSLEDIKQVKLE